MLSLDPIQPRAAGNGWDNVRGTRTVKGKGFRKAWWGTLLLIAGSALGETVDFESSAYVAGNSIVGTDGWANAGLFGSGSKFVCQAEASEKVLQVTTQSNHTISRKFPTVSDSLDLRWSWQPRQGRSSLCLGPSANQSSSASNLAVTVCLNPDGGFSAKGLDAAANASWPKWSYQTWYHMRLRLNLVLGTYSLYLDTLAARTGETALATNQKLRISSSMGYLAVQSNGSLASSNPEPLVGIDNLAWTAPIAGENYAEWSRFARLTFNTTAAGADVPGFVEDFPLLVRFTADQFNFAEARPDGGDLRFADPGGAPLAFQIERWDPTLKKGEAWVKVPRVDGNSDQDYITVYWGKGDATWKSDGSKVFPESDGFRGVWHLGEARAEVRLNAVGSGNNATPMGYAGNEGREGIIALGDFLDGGDPNEYLDLGDGFADFTTGFTFSVWAHAAKVASGNAILDLGNGSARDNVLLTRQKTSDSIILSNYSRNGSGSLNSNSGALPLGQWQHLAATISGNSAVLYVNGSRVNSGTLNPSIARVARTVNYLGKSSWGSDNCFAGDLDEAQLSAVVRSADWIKLAYESQRAGSSLVAFGSGVTLPLTITAHPDSRTAAEGSYTAFSVSATSSSPMAYQWLKDGKVLAGSTGPAHYISSVRSADAGAYACRVTNGTDTLTSRSATLTVSENYALWDNSRRIAFNTTSAGSGVEGNVQNFPLQVRLDTSRFRFSEALAKGDDIRFADDDGTPLSYQIARWDSAAGQADIWVRVPEVRGNSDQDYITLYWGRAGAASASSSASVFRTEDRFKGAWHLDEASGNALDATVNGYSGIPKDAVPNQQGVIGGAYAFGGGDDRVSLPVGATSGLKAFTFSLWAKETVTGSNSDFTHCPTLVGMGVINEGSKDFGIVSKSGKLGIWHGLNTSSNNTEGISTISLNDGKWHHLAAAFQGGKLTLYEGGVPLLNLVATDSGLADRGFDLGAYNTPSDGHANGFTGFIDGLQIASEARSPDWIKLAYETQKPGSQALVFGRPSVLPLPTPLANPPGGIYSSARSVILSCADSTGRIFYTLDGSAPDTTNPSVTFAYSQPVALSATATLKAVAFGDGKASLVLTERYEFIRGPASSGVDTLRPGESINMGGGFVIAYPKGIGTSMVLLKYASAQGRLPSGFERVGPLLLFSSLEPQLAFPAINITGLDASLDQISLFRLGDDGRVRWLPPVAGVLTLSAPGAYFWGQDVMPPRIRFLESVPGSGDSTSVVFQIEDNVINLRGRLRYWTEVPDSLSWREGTSGETLTFGVRLPGHPAVPLQLQLTVSDFSLSASFPGNEANRFTLSRSLPALSSSRALPPGIGWILGGAPLDFHPAPTLGGLSRANGSPIYAALWDAAKGDSGDYRVLRDEDTLPTGSGVWLAAKHGVKDLVFPAAYSYASDTGGYFSLRLRNGWNLVTCPSFQPIPWPVSRSEKIAYIQSDVKGLHGFQDSDYVEKDTLEPWKGYFVHYSGTDTLIRLGVRRPAFMLAKAGMMDARAMGAATAGLTMTLGTPQGRSLEMGAYAWASEGLGREDEVQPPPREDRGGAWLLRDKRRLASDNLRLEGAKAYRWTVVVRGPASGPRLPADQRLRMLAMDLPEGYQAWAVFPSRRVKYRLETETGFPIAGNDTLEIYAGTPGALASMPDLMRERESPTDFRVRLSSLNGEGTLSLALPSVAALEVRFWSLKGRRVGGFRRAALGPGFYFWSLPSVLGGPGGKPAAGVYLVEIRVVGREYSFHRTEKLNWGW